MARSDGGRQLLCLLAVVPAALAFNIPPAHMLSAPHARGMALPRGMVVPGGLPPSLRTRRPALRAKGRSSLERDDPEYKAVLARQKLLTEAMDVLTQYDEAQADFQVSHPAPKRTVQPDVSRGLDFPGALRGLQCPPG